MNKRSSKAMMIVLLVFLLLATANLFLSLDYQIGRPENSYRTSIAPHDSKEDIRSPIIYKPIVKVYKAAQVGVITVSIGFIAFADYCIRRKLYGRVEVVSFALSLVYWAAEEFVIWM